MTHSRTVVATVAGLALACGLARDVSAQPSARSTAHPTEAAGLAGADNPSACSAPIASTADPSRAPVRPAQPPAAPAAAGGDRGPASPTPPSVTTSDGTATTAVATEPTDPGSGTAI